VILTRGLHHNLATSQSKIARTCSLNVVIFLKKLKKNGKFGGFCPKKLLCRSYNPLFFKFPNGKISPQKKKVLINSTEL
jgi:hypothetical protein